MIAAIFQQHQATYLEGACRVEGRARAHKQTHRSYREEDETISHHERVNEIRSGVQDNP